MDLKDILGPNKFRGGVYAPYIPYDRVILIQRL